MTIEISRTK